jgi:hypothetical protein
MNYLDIYGTTDYVDENEIKSFGPLVNSDIKIKDGGNFLTEMVPNFTVYIKNRCIGKKNHLYINRLYSLNNLIIPDFYKRYDENYVNRYLDPPPVISLFDSDIMNMTGGGSNIDYYSKYLKYKNKYLKLKQKN